MNPFYNPSFNLALEEYLLTGSNMEIIMLWQNNPSVIIGNNQNTIEEINDEYTKENDIYVVRRLSGGGAVFHDLGNINYTIINKQSEDNFGGYDAFTLPVQEYLKTLGINAEFSGRNDLVINGEKFSGNAQAMKKDRIMHHGCILFNTDFSHLVSALKPKSEKIESKGIKSIRSRVTNVSSHLSTPMTSDEFLQGLGHHFEKTVANIKKYELTKQDIAGAQKLSNEKYSTWEWNYGRSPIYNWQNSKRFNFGTVDVRLNVKGGNIEDITFFGDFFGVLEKEGLEKLLVGTRHDKQHIMEAIGNTNIGLYIHGMTSPELGALICP